MSASFNGAGGYIVTTAGGAANCGTGAFTYMALFNLTLGNSGIASGFASTTLTRELLTDTAHLFSRNDFSASGFGTATPGSWFVGGVSKAAGSSLYQYHLWPYDPAGTGTMSHGGSGQSDSDGSALTLLRIGDAENNVVKGNCLIAVDSWWASKVADASLDTLKSNQISAWDSLTPAELRHLGSWDGVNAVTRIRGSSVFSSLNGTVGVGANPTGFNFSLAGAPVQAGAMAMFF
jgi:hypothetical protein